MLLVLECILWWYGAGWQQIMQNVTLKIRSVSRVFSVSILVKTLFAPWRRITAPPGASLDAKMQALRDNLIGRFIGFTVRVSVLISAAIITLIIAAGGALLCVIWPVIPMLALACCIWGIVQ
jgi:hypothetical protein